MSQWASVVFMYDSRLILGAFNAPESESDKVVLVISFAPYAAIGIVVSGAC